MKKRKVDIAVIGEVTFDDIVPLDRPMMKDRIGGDGIYALGGAYIWKREGLGLAVRCGYDFDISALEKLTDGGVDLSGVVTVPEYPNLHIFNMFDREGNRYFIYQRWAGKEEQFAPRPEDIPKSYLEADAILLAALMFPFGKNMIESLPDKSTGTVVMVDPHYDYMYAENREDWRKLFDRISIFMPSEEELLRFTGSKRQEDVKDYVPMLREITGMGPSICGVKLGERGAMAYDSKTGECYRVPAYHSENIVDVTGCGDSFCGGFISGYMKNRDIFDGLILGTLSSSFNLEQYGSLANYEVTDEQAESRYREFTARVTKENSKINL